MINKQTSTHKLPGVYLSSVFDSWDEWSWADFLDKRIIWWPVEEGDKSSRNMTQDCRLSWLCNYCHLAPNSTLYILPQVLGVGVLSRSVGSDAVWPHGPQTARFLSPSGFSRQEYWRGLPLPPPGDLSDPGLHRVLLRLGLDLCRAFFLLKAGIFLGSATRGH